MILRGMVASKELAMETGLTVIAPDPDADTGPDAGMKGAPGCCYVLHGIYANHENWAAYSMLPVYARKHNIVFVMPEAARSFYADMRYGQKFFSYVADELPEIVAKTFAVSTAREDTSVMGGSMGGNGALAIALRRPDRYARCGAFGSAALFMKRFMDSLGGGDRAAKLEGIVGPQLAMDFRALLGDSFAVPPELDLPGLAGALASASVRPEFYSACGVDDAMFREENVSFAKLMRSFGYDFVHEELEGGHDWLFFDRAIRRCLEFFFG